MALLICWPVSVAAQDAYVVGDCSLPQAEAILETGNVEARIYNDGRLFFRGSPHLYRVPKSGQAHAVFAANLWVGGFVDNELRVTGSTYGPTEFWSGPLPESGGPPEDCASFDRFWRLDFEQHLDGSSGSLVLTPETQEWPVHLGAPYIDTDGIEGYHPERGDYPVMHGDSQLWWIMNDRGNTHESFRTRPLGVEVLASAFGFASENDLGNVTFYRYMISNNGSMPIENAHVAMHQDMDLGVPKDDSAGSDSTLALAYLYQQANVDQPWSAEGTYGENPPAVGFTVLEASHSNGQLPSDLGLSPSHHATAAHNVFNGGGVTGDPRHAHDAWHYMNGRWRDGRAVTEGGNGLDSEGPVTRWWMPGEPTTDSFWSERNTDGSGSMMGPSDRKLTLSFRGFDLHPGEWARFTFAIVWAQGADHLDSVAQLKALTASLHASTASLLAPRTPIPPRFIDGNPPEPAQFPFWVDEPYPNPASDHVNLRMSLKWNALVTMEVVDALGRTQSRESFEGIPGPVTRRIQTVGLAPGTYMVRVSQRGEHVDWPLIVL